MQSGKTGFTEVHSVCLFLYKLSFALNIRNIRQSAFFEDWMVETLRAGRRKGRILSPVREKEGSRVSNIFQNGGFY